MEILFHDPDDPLLPPDKVQIRNLRVEPLPDGRRIRVYLEITPFLQRPNADLQIIDALGVDVANIHVIETMDPRMEFTMHLRSAITKGVYTLSVMIFYHQTDPQGVDQSDKARSPIFVVDKTQTQFVIP